MSEHAVMVRIGLEVQSEYLANLGDTGKHDVSTLSHRHSTPHGHGHRSLSMSLRGTGKRGGSTTPGTTAATPTR